jgi:hypothetical protein
MRVGVSSALVAIGYIFLALAAAEEAYTPGEEVVSLDAAGEASLFEEGAKVPGHPEKQGLQRTVELGEAYSYVVETVRTRPGLSEILPEIMRDQLNNVQLGEASKSHAKEQSRSYSSGSSETAKVSRVTSTASRLSSGINLALKEAEIKYKQGLSSCEQSQRSIAAEAAGLKAERSGLEERLRLGRESIGIAERSIAEARERSGSLEEEMGAMIRARSKASQRYQQGEAVREKSLEKIALSLQMMCALTEYASTKPCKEDEKAALPGVVTRYTDGVSGNLPAGTACQLPFKHEGKTYEDCAPGYRHGWCSQDSSHTSSSKWGSCSPRVFTDSEEIKKIAKSTQTDEKKLTEAFKAESITTGATAESFLLDDIDFIETQEEAATENPEMNNLGEGIVGGISVYHEMVTSQVAALQTAMANQETATASGMLETLLSMRENLRREANTAASRWMREEDGFEKSEKSLQKGLRGEEETILSLKEALVRHELAKNEARELLVQNGRASERSRAAEEADRKRCDEMRYRHAVVKRDGEFDLSVLDHVRSLFSTNTPSCPGGCGEEGTCVYRGASTTTTYCACKYGHYGDQCQKKRCPGKPYGVASESTGVKLFMAHEPWACSGHGACDASTGRCGSSCLAPPQLCRYPNTASGLRGVLLNPPNGTTLPASFTLEKAQIYCDENPKCLGFSFPQAGGSYNSQGTNQGDYTRTTGLGKAQFYTVPDPQETVETWGMDMYLKASTCPKLTFLKRGERRSGPKAVRASKLPSGTTVSVKDAGKACALEKSCVSFLKDGTTGVVSYYAYPAQESIPKGSERKSDLYVLAREGAEWLELPQSSIQNDQSHTSVSPVVNGECRWSFEDATTQGWKTTPSCGANFGQQPVSAATCPARSSTAMTLRGPVVRTADANGEFRDSAPYKCGNEGELCSCTGTVVYGRRYPVQEEVIADYPASQQKACCNGGGKILFLDLNMDGGLGLETTKTKCAKKCRDFPGCNFYSADPSGSTGRCVGYSSCEKKCNVSWGKASSLYRMRRGGPYGYTMIGEGSCSASGVPSKYTMTTSKMRECAERCDGLDTCASFQYCDGDASCQGQCDLFVPSSFGSHGSGKEGLKYTPGKAIACDKSNLNTKQKHWKLYKKKISGTTTLNWRVMTEATKRGDAYASAPGSNGGSCWEVGELEFYQSTDCQMGQMMVGSSEMISSSSGGGAETVSLRRGFDGDPSTNYEARSSKISGGKVWLGAKGLSDLGCIRVYQPRVETSQCGPTSKVKVQYQEEMGGGWRTLISRDWDGSRQGWNQFKVGEIRNWRLLAESTTGMPDSEETLGEGSVTAHPSCWDLNALSFYSDTACTKAINITAQNRIASGATGQLSNAFDGDASTTWGGRSGAGGRSEVWVGARSVEKPACIKMVQADTTADGKNGGGKACRPKGDVKLQYQVNDEGAWVTQEKRAWAADTAAGAHLFYPTSSTKETSPQINDVASMTAHPFAYNQAEGQILCNVAGMGRDPAKGESKQCMCIPGKGVEQMAGGLRSGRSLHLGGGDTINDI